MFTVFLHWRAVKETLRRKQQCHCWLSSGGFIPIRDKSKQLNQLVFYPPHSSELINLECRSNPILPPVHFQRLPLPAKENPDSSGWRQKFFHAGLCTPPAMAPPHWPSPSHSRATWAGVALSTRSVHFPILTLWPTMLPLLEGLLLAQSTPVHPAGPNFKAISYLIPAPRSLAEFILPLVVTCPLLLLQPRC